MGNSKFNRLVSVGASILFTVLELVASLVLSVVFAPFLFLLWLTNETVRLGISGIFYFQAKNPQNPKMSLVSEGADAIWAFRKPGNSRNIIILYIYNSRMSLDVFRRNYDEKVIKYVDAKGRRPYEKLTTTFKRKFGYYCWAECKTFDIKNHIRNIHKDGREDEVVTETEVLQFMSTLTGDMSEAQPQWEEILVPRFAYDEDAFNGMDKIPERSARIYRSHHAYMVIKIKRRAQALIRQYFRSPPLFVTLIGRLFESFNGGDVHGGPQQELPVCFGPDCTHQGGKLEASCLQGHLRHFWAHDRIEEHLCGFPNQEPFPHENVFRETKFHVVSRPGPEHDQEY